MRVAVSRRRAHSPTPPLSPPRRVASAHSPRRFPFGSDPGTGLPFVRYPESGPFHVPEWLALAERGAFGAPLRGGSAASLPHSLAKWTDHRLVGSKASEYLPGSSMPTLTLTLSLSLNTTVRTIDTDPTLHRMKPGASLRDRATLPSPLRGLDPSGGYPSRLRSLRSLRALLARRLAPLTAAPVSPLVRVACARRRSHSPTPPCWLPRPLPCAHAPRRLPLGSVAGTAFPFVRYPGSGSLDALRRLGSHTRRISDAGRALSAQRCAGMRRTYPPA